jgi:L-amino acid N-acyltransferase YncA
MIVRDATVADMRVVADILNDVIVNTTAVWSDTPVTVNDRVDWFEQRRQEGYPVLVAADEADEVAGYASFGDFRQWPGYAATVEHSVHVSAAHRGAGIGTLLVSELVERAAILGKHVLIAGIEATNAASLHLHRNLGFTQVAYLPEVGRKFDRWLDLVLLHRLLQP